MVNAGVIRRDARKFAEARRALQQFTTAELIAISQKAGELFMTAELPLGEGQTQTVDDYIARLSGTSGLPYTLVRANMAKIHEGLTEMPAILRGLTRGLDLSILDEGSGEQDGIPISYFAQTQSLGVVLPSNSPGVNSLWLPSVALKIPVIVKPGREEPWTPLRIIQSFIAAGAPAKAFGFYPTDHEGSSAVMESCGRAIIFGGQDTVDRYAGDPSVEVHGPGWSKVLIGEDQADNWRDHIDVIVKSIAANSGRSCINASAIIVPRHGREIAEAIAQRLAEIKPLRRDDEHAALSGFANPKMAEWMDAQIEQGLETPGAEDLTAVLRGDGQGGGARKLVQEGITYLHPTLVHCESWNHPLANKEFMFPFATVVEMPQDEMLEKIGSSLVVTAITENADFIDELLASPMILRLNIGALPTSTAKWDQPHEGNLFEFLYRRRAIQRAPALAGSSG